MSQKGSSPKPGIVRNKLSVRKEHHCRGFGEVAGGTTAACAALCCCPCGLVHLAALAFVKLPTGLCKKALKKIKKKVKAKKRVQDKPADDTEEIHVSEESSMALARDEFMGSSDPRGVVKLQIVVTRLSTEECWQEVTGKGYVGFWRNYSLE